MGRKTFRIKTALTAQCTFGDPPQIAKGVLIDIGIADHESGAAAAGCGFKALRDDIGFAQKVSISFHLGAREFKLDGRVRGRKKLPGTSSHIYGISFFTLTVEERLAIEAWLIRHAERVEYPAGIDLVCNAPAETPCDPDEQWEKWFGN